MELFVFSQDEQLLTIISEDTGLVEAPYRIEVNSVPTEPFSFTVKSDQKVAEHVKEENKVVFKDHEGDWRLMNIKEVDDSNNSDGPVTIATCEPAFLAELNEHIVVDRRFVNQTADVVLAAAVEGTRWQASVEVELGKATINFYYVSSMEAIWKTIETWGGEFKDIVNFDEITNTITGCYVKILQRLGAENGQRFEIDHNTTEIGRTVLSYPKTALYGRGSSLEVEDDDGNHTGGYTRYIDFADVEWSIAKGNPVDKPKGQKWVGDPEALKVYGYEGKMKHRFGIFSNQDYEEPADLLQATWEALQDTKKPEVNYHLSVQLFDEKVSLGDTCQAIDRMFSRPIEIQARVIAMEYDLLDIEGTMVVEMGQFLDLGDEISDIKEEIENIKNNPPKQKVDEGSYPNIKPGTPVNVEAYGGMEVIQLYWDYASQIYVKHYEVYGSRTDDFVPDSQHLLWRGNTSAFAHTAGTDEVWYYRIRAVNYHGTPSDWSVQVRAATHRVISDDILFNPELAERLRELSEIAQTIADGTINFDHLDGTIINGNRIKGDLIAIDGTTYIQEGVIGNAAIANGAIDRAKLGTAVVGAAEIENGAITNAKIANLNVDKLYGSRIQGIDIQGARFYSTSGNNWVEIVGGDMRLRQSNGSYVDISPVGMYGYNTSGELRFQSDLSLTTSAAFGTVNTNVYLGSFSETRSVTYNSIGGDGAIDSYIYTDVRAKHFYGNVLEANWGVNNATNVYLRPRAGGEIRVTAGQTTDTYLDLRSRGLYATYLDRNLNHGSGESIYVRPASNGELRVTRIGTTDRYLDVRAYGLKINAIDFNTDASSGANLYVRTVAGGELRFTINGGTSVYVDIRSRYTYTNVVEINALHGSGSHLYLRSGGTGEVRATAAGRTDAYRPVRALDYLPPNSTRESKKHIDLFNDNTLDTFRTTNVYQFLYKWQDDDEKQRLGIMLDEVPDCIVAPTGDTLEMYSTIGFLWKGLKDTITYLDDEINWQRVEYQDLKNKVTKLEERVEELEEMVA